MNHTKHDYQRAFEKFKSLNPDMWRRYETPAAAELLLEYLVQQQQPAGLVTTELAIKTLVRQGLLIRVDSRTFEDDKQQALQKITAQIDAPDLTRSEVEYFQELSARDLETLYWADGGYNRFAVRYNKAVKTKPYGLIFQVPGRPASTVDDDVEAVALTAKEYHSMPANRIIQRIKSDPGFKKAIDNLIKAGQI